MILILNCTWFDIMELSLKDLVLLVIVALLLNGNSVWYILSNGTIVCPVTYPEERDTGVSIGVEVFVV